jgi:hypothetical protein
MEVEVRAACHDARERRLNRQARKHAHVTAARVARRNTADGRSYRAENDANDLSDRCEALLAPDRDLEHEPVRHHMPPNLRLAEDVSALEMLEGVAEVALPDELSGQPELLFEQSLVHGVHARRICNLDATFLSGRNRGFSGEMAPQSHGVRTDGCGQSSARAGLGGSQIGGRMALRR